MRKLLYHATANWGGAATFSVLTCTRARVTRVDYQVLLFVILDFQTVQFFPSPLTSTNDPILANKLVSVPLLKQSRLPWMSASQPKFVIQKRSLGVPSVIRELKMLAYRLRPKKRKPTKLVPSRRAEGFVKSSRFLDPSISWLGWVLWRLERRQSFVSFFLVDEDFVLEWVWQRREAGQPKHST
jgi:hypothetical protein